MNYNIKYGYPESVSFKVLVLNFESSIVFGISSALQNNNKKDLEGLKAYSVFQCTIWDFENAWVWPDYLMC